jgi:hypothetical protein
MKQYYQVNWINGMKITSDHFIDLEKHFIYRVRNSIKGVINDMSYGLLPPEDKEINSPRFNLLLNEKKIRVLSDFAMISPGGDFVNIPANLEFELLKPPGEASQYYLVLTIDPYERVPFGEINDLESPLRNPNAIPAYRFHFLARNSNTSNSFGNAIIPVAKYSGSSFEEDDSYIPPCTSVKSHPTLVELCNDVLISFVELERKVFELLKKPNITNKAILINLANFLALNKTALDWYISHQPPVFLFEKIVQLAKVFYNTMEIQNMNYKDDMKGLLSKVVELRYDHMEISAAVSVTKSFLKNYSKLLPKDDTIFGV